MRSLFMLMIMAPIYKSSREMRSKILKQNCAYSCNGVIYDHCDVDDDNFCDNNKDNKTITCAVHDNDDEKAAT